MVVPEPRVKFTYADFRRLGEEKNHEVHDGDLVGIYGEGQTLTSPTLRGFTLDLDSIF